MSSCPGGSCCREANHCTVCWRSRSPSIRLVAPHAVVELLPQGLAKRHLHTSSGADAVVAWWAAGALAAVSAACLAHTSPASMLRLPACLQPTEAPMSLSAGTTAPAAPSFCGRAQRPSWTGCRWACQRLQHGRSRPALHCSSTHQAEAIAFIATRVLDLFVSGCPSLPKRRLSAWEPQPGERSRVLRPPPLLPGAPAYLHPSPALTAFLRSSPYSCALQLLPGVSVHRGFLNQMSSLTTTPDNQGDNITAVLLELSGGQTPWRVVVSGERPQPASRRPLPMLLPLLCHVAGDGMHNLHCPAPAQAAQPIQGSPRAAFGRRFRPPPGTLMYTMLRCTACW